MSRLAGALVLGVLLLPARPSAADAPPLHEGKTLEDWILQLSDKDGRRVGEALGALSRSRYVVGAEKDVVPALAYFIKNVPAGQWVDRAATEALARFGPLALPAAPTIRELGARSGYASQCWVIRIRLGDGPQEAVTELKAYLQRWLEKEPKDSPFFDGNAADLATLGARLGELRPELVAHMDRVQPDDIVEIAAGMKSRGAPWMATALARTRAKTAFVRGYAATVLAWCPDLDPEADKVLLRTAKGLLPGPHLRAVTEGLASTPHQPAAEFVAFLQGRAAGKDAVTAAWARVGLAMRLEGAPRAALVTAFTAACRHADPEVRTAGAEGILLLARAGVEPVPDLATLLADPDLRVRWRAAAVLLRSDAHADAAVVELKRVVDGPDDDERIAAFRVLPWLGDRASALVPAVLRWRDGPFAEIRREAEQAFAGMGKK